MELKARLARLQISVISAGAFAARKVAATDDVDERKNLFMRLARENESTLVRVSRRLCWCDRDMADDCVQEAIVSAYRAFVGGKFQDVENFRPWILKILMNAYLRETARVSKSGTRQNLELLEERTRLDNAPGPDQAMLDHCLNEDLERAMRTLSDDQRRCILLVDVEGMDYAEAAVALTVPIGTVRSRLARARLQMAEVLTAAPRRDNEKGKNDDTR